MNKRAEAILMQVLDRKLKICDLAKRYAVTERTIRNDVNIINEYLYQYRLSEVIIDNSVLSANIDKKDFFDKTGNKINFYDYKLSKEERVHIITKLLIENESFITLGDLAQIVYVSRATVINDLPRLKEFVQESGLQIVSQSSKGISIAGKESNKRSILLNILLDFNDNDLLIQNSFNGDIVVNDKITKIVNNLEHVHGIYFTDESFAMVIKYLQIMLIRILGGYTVESHERNSSNKKDMAKDILEYMEQYLEVPIPKEEIGAFSDILNQLRYMKHDLEDTKIVKIQFLTRKYIEAISSELEINLSHDYEFFESLSNHLNSIFMKSFIALRNDDILNTVLEDNKDILEVVKRHAYHIHTYADREMTEEEFAYIVIHVLAALERNKNQDVLFSAMLVCNGGIGSSHLLLEQLKRYFNFKFTRVISAHDIRDEYYEEVDIVLSTIPLETQHKNYLQVYSILNDRDYIKIGAKLDEIRVSKNIGYNRNQNSKRIMEFMKPFLEEEIALENSVIEKLEEKIAVYFGESIEKKENYLLRDLLKENNIQVDLECNDWEDAITQASQPLLENGVIEQRYIDAMINNVHENGAYIVMQAGLAIPHEGFDAGTNAVGMNLIILTKPLPFGHEDFDPVKYVCVLSAIDKKKHLQAFFNLVNVFANQKFRKSLELASTPKEMARVINRYERELEG